MSIDRQSMYEKETNDIENVIINFINLRRLVTDLVIEKDNRERVLKEINDEIDKNNIRLEQLKTIIVTKEELKAREEYLNNKEASIKEFHKEAFDLSDKAEEMNKKVDKDIARLEADQREFDFERNSIYRYTKAIQEEINKGNKIDVVNFIKNIK